MSDEKTVTPRQHPKNFKYAVTLVVAIGLILGQHICLQTAHNRLSFVENQLLDRETELANTHQQMQLQAVAFKNAYAQLVKKLKEIEEKYRRGSMASAENEERLKASFEIISENLTEIQQLTNDLSKCSHHLDVSTANYQQLLDKMKGLLQALEEQGVTVEFTDQSAEN